MKTKVFAYKGHLGALTDLINGKFINNPTTGGQLGCVIDSKEIEITKEAKELIRNAGREGGSFAPIMLTAHADGSGSSLGLMGFGKHYFGKGTDIKIGRTCEKKVLDDMTEVEMEIPQDFKEFIDKMDG